MYVCIYMSFVHINIYLSCWYSVLFESENTLLRHETLGPFFFPRITEKGYEGDFPSPAISGKGKWVKSLMTQKVSGYISQQSHEKVRRVHVVYPIVLVNKHTHTHTHV